MNIALVRVSSLSQQKNTSLEQQKTRIQAYCQFNDLHVDKVIEEVESGAKETREGLELLRSLVDTGIVKRVIVLKLDRFSRDLFAGLKWLKYLNDNGVELISISEKIDNSISGKLMTQLLLSLAEYEKSTIVQRLNRGKERRFSEGHRTCGNIPFGYEYDDNDKLVLNENHKRTIRFIFRRWMQLGGLNRTRRMHVLLYELGRRGYTYLGGSAFNYSRVRYILKNPIYSGQLTVKNLGAVQHQYESIISISYFKRIQASLR
ncbi:MAG: recombinase family protein [Candidatus Marinimicrobia bacterium]|nr:recombinase family protein [Candidatus Neomarinimicrobiota bacterium]